MLFLLLRSCPPQLEGYWWASVLVFWTVKQVDLKLLLWLKLKHRLRIRPGEVDGDCFFFFSYRMWLDGCWHIIIATIAMWLCVISSAQAGIMRPQGWAYITCDYTSSCQRLTVCVTSVQPQTLNKENLGNLLQRNMFLICCGQMCERTLRDRFLHYGL